MPALVVGIGASAGGLEPIEALLDDMPLGSGLSFVVVRHLAAHHPSLQVELLARHTDMAVVEATSGLRPEADHVYVITPGTVLVVENGVFKVTLADDASRSAPIDTFFASLAGDFAEQAVAILLSGAGHDGTIGLRAIKEHGGLTFAQSPETAQHNSMPQSAVATGLVDHVLPPKQIVIRLIEHARYVAQQFAPSSLEVQLRDHLGPICGLVHKHTDNDFSNYKEGTLLRRIRRRLQVLRVETVSDYIHILSINRLEADALVKDLLIGVTQFFRDSDAFEFLAAQVLPHITQRKPLDAPLRIWVAGCASGEEAYTIAMLVREHLERLGQKRFVQIFATDLDTEMLLEARQGRYALSISEHVSAERLERFFVREGDAYLASKELREMCLFSQHSLIRDPPFSQLDLVSCRNVLIYLSADLQRKLVPLFHYALRPGSFLLLGPSEGVTQSPELFESLDKKIRIFRRKDTVVKPVVDFPLSVRSHAPAARAVPSSVPQTDTKERVGTAFERAILQEYAPAAAVINERGEVHFVAGPLARFLDLPAGALTTNLFEALRGALRLELRKALTLAISAKRTCVRNDVPVEIEGQVRLHRLILRPMPTIEAEAGLYMVILEERSREPGGPEAIESSPLHDEPVVQQLESELRTTRAELRATVEELESANEELKSSNEELISTNEELQSANEELQSSKEELQSVNEELETVNTELREKVDELASANSDLQNLFAATQIATIFLDRSLKITKYTPAATSLFHLSDADVGRPLSDLAARFAGQDLLSDAREVLRILAPVERQVQSVDGAWFVLRVLPYRTIENFIAGVVVTFVDISQVKRAEQTAKEQAQLVHLSHDAIFVRRFDGTIESWNNGAQELYGYSRDEAIGQNSNRLLETEFPAPFADIEAELRRSGRWNGELRHRTKDGRSVTVLSSKQYARGDDGVERILEANHDITQRAQSERELRESEQRFVAIYDHAPFAIALITDPDGTLTAVNDAWEKTFGYSREEALGRTPVELGLASDPEGRLRMYSEVRNSGNVRDWELEFTTKSGDRRLAAFSFDLIELAGQKYRLGTAVDITDRRRAEQALRFSEEKFSKAFLGNTSAMAITRLSDGVFVEVNERWQEVTGFTRAEAVGKASLPLNIWKDVEERAQFVRELQQHGMTKNAEFRFVRRGGAEWTGLVSSQVSQLQGEPMVISSIVDITERNRAEAELRRYALVVQQSRDIILFMNRDDGRIIEANPAAAVAYGYSRDELLGLTIQDLRAPETQEVVAEQMEYADTKGVLFESAHRRKDGSTFPVEVSSRGAAAGGTRTLVSVVRDITDRRRAEVNEREQRQQAEQRAAELDTILDALAEPLMVCDAQGGLVRANPAFRQMLGHPDEWRDLSISERLRRVRLEAADGQPVDPKQAPGARALTGETVHGVLQRLPRPDGSVLHLSTSSAPIRTGRGIVGAVVVFSDISERVRAEQELREADQRKNDFLAVLSHELRNPLTPVRNSLYVLRNAPPGSAQAKQAEDVIDRQTNQLARLVDDLLDITRVSHNKIRLRLARLDLNEVARRALEDHRPLFAERGITVDQTLSTETLVIDGDDARLAQVIGNLLSNAAKFTPRGGTVTLRTVKQAARRRAQLWVIDTGAGLEPTVLRRLFQPFMQAEMTLDRSEGGLGLGLALVKTLVELHGGEVCAHSEGLAKGTELVVELPLALATTVEGMVAEVTNAPRPRRVLIIEDNVDAADSLRDALGFGGHLVEVAYDGPAGLKNAKEFQPEVVLCDIGLPGMDGYELARAFQSDESLKGVYLVALTGYALPDDLERAAKAGFKRHLAKPPSIEDLEEVLAGAP
jgi:PAS domain S-box-containing protein